ncbi:GH92 family glycosyl hydrolase [Mollicutes bacterium LVI A0039]|nr:GH92 family glycosyl hydrolase [Mollicutes bacterium LVI A0039]
MNYINFVNIDVGTDSEYRESNGNTLPNVQYPFGNQAYCFQSNKNDHGWFYKPRANYMEGIRITNQPSPWLGDYGQITLLPFTGKYNVDLHSTVLDKQHNPASMSGYIKRYETGFKLVPSKRGAKLNVKNKSGLESKFLIDCHSSLSTYHLDNNTLYLQVTNIPEGIYSANYRKFYVLQFDTNVVSAQGIADSVEISCSEATGLNIELTLKGSDYTVDIASSYISFEMAMLQINRQKDFTLELLEKQTTQKWNEYLSTIEVTDKLSDTDLETFYSNMYRIFCFPRTISEIDENGTEVYFNFKTTKVDVGVMISDVGFWDTYRTTMPLFEMIIPKQYKRIIEAILNYYKSYGWLPRWLAPYERGIMPSTLVDAVVSRALVNESIVGNDKEVAIEAILKNGDCISGDKLFGREHLDEYLKYGYVPGSAPGESVSLSLDNYFCDYAIYKALEKNKHKDSERYYQRSQNYKKIFNTKNQRFERVDEEGKFDNGFNPNEWGTDFCESSSWQNNLNLVHDHVGFIELMGGPVELETVIDTIFSKTPTYDVGKYGFEIHEMTEYARVRDLGHFAISNQPSFNLPFWYILIGKQQKFEEVINKTLNYFTSEYNGYPGDEDNGSLAAWYILVSIGCYPLNPMDDMLQFKSRFNYKINKI